MYSANWTVYKLALSGGSHASTALCQMVLGADINILVSPASPEKAIKVCLLRGRVLSSSAFRIVAPRIAALEAAMMVKSLPVIPNRTSLRCGRQC